MARPDSKWYKLDSAGILYSALQKEEYSAIYRFSARMEGEVDPAALQRAIDRCMPRFPSFAVRIRKGLFWYYLEPNHAPGPFLKEDVSDPCQPVRFREDNGWLVRFYYYRERISVEVFHALSDGGVAADVVARRGGHLHRAHHPAARRAPRALAARGGPPTLQYVKKGGHGARHAFPFLVPVVGLEPTRSRPRRILNPLRLPFHHTGLFCKILL